MQNLAAPFDLSTRTSSARATSRCAPSTATTRARAPLSSASAAHLDARPAHRAALALRAGDALHDLALAEALCAATPARRAVDRRRRVVPRAPLRRPRAPRDGARRDAPARPARTRHGARRAPQACGRRRRVARPRRGRAARVGGPPEATPAGSPRTSAPKRPSPSCDAGSTTRATRPLRSCPSPAPSSRAPCGPAATRRAPSAPSSPPSPRSTRGSSPRPP